MALSAGIRLGPYEIIGAIGAGGMGEVYKARDTRLDRTVAIKVLPADVANDPDLRARFEREARAIAALDHPHICAIYDVGESQVLAAAGGSQEPSAISHDVVRFIVMQHLEGETLAARLARSKDRALPMSEVLKIGVEIADALDKAHRAGITHRDLKPANIFLVRRGGASAPPEAKLLDFGLAKLRGPTIVGHGFSRAGTAEAVPYAAGITAHGSILGTVHYMAPEQVEGKEADARSDIWALGVVIYEMATGTHPFAGDSPASVIGAILKDHPSRLSARQPLAPLALDRVIETCLAKDPDNRWQSARDLTTQLKWAAEPDAVAIAARSTNKRERLAWIVAAAFCLATIGLLVWSSRRAPAATEPVRFIVMPPDDGMFPGDGVAGSNLQGPQFAMAPDARHLAFVASTADGHRRLWVRGLDTVTARPLAGTEGASRPFWSPDSRFIGFFAAARLKTIPADGGPVQVLCDAASPRGGTWNQDGVIVFSPGFQDGLYRVPAAGGRPTPVTRLDPARQELSHRWPEFLPDGRHFLYLVRSSQRDQTGAYVGSIDSTDTQRVLDTEFFAGVASPGYVLFVREGALLAQPFDLGARRLTGDPVPVADHVGSGQATGEAPFSVSASALAYSDSIRLPPTQLTWVDRTGQAHGAIDSLGEYENPVLSPDGQRAAVHRVDPDTPLNMDIWLANAIHGGFSKFTFDPKTVEYSPVWSPDGSHVAFGSNPMGTLDLYQKLSTGGREELLLKTNSNGAFPTGWSSDGRFVIYVAAGAKSGFDVWVLPQFGDRKPFAFLQSSANETQAQLSADGRWMAYTSDETGAPEVYVQPFPATGAKWQVSAGGGSDPQWRRDGRELFYVAVDGRLMAAPVKGAASTFEAGTGQPLFQTRRPLARGPLLFTSYAPAADGQRFLVNRLAADVPSLPITIVLNWQAALKK